MPYKLDTETHVYFYEQEFYALSNFAAFRLHWGGHDFMTSEHAYQWEKFNYRGSGAQHLRKQVRLARSAHAACKIAEAHRALVHPQWAERKVDLMRQILRAKASEHPYVRRKLLETGARLLVEDSWRDDFWGAGADWYGRNMLGKLWMEIRDDLRTQTAALGVTT